MGSCTCSMEPRDQGRTCRPCESPPTAALRRSPPVFTNLYRMLPVSRLPPEPKRGGQGTVWVGSLPQARDFRVT